MQATTSTKQLINQAERLWAKLYDASKNEPRYTTALNALESSIAELYKLAQEAQ